MLKEPHQQLNWPAEVKCLAQGHSFPMYASHLPAVLERIKAQKGLGTKITIGTITPYTAS